MYVYVCIHVCVCVYLYIYIYIHVYVRNIFCLRAHLSTLAAYSSSILEDAIHGHLGLYMRVCMYIYVNQAAPQ
jgi:hypothetical protein